MRPLSLLAALSIAAANAQAQAVPRKQLVEEVRLDATTEDFPDVSSVLVNSRGEMAVFVGKDQQFRFYDASGKRLGVLGRVGSGPGEFRRANFLGWAGDTIWLYDVDLRRVTYVSPTRQVLRTETLNQSLNAMGGFAPGSAPPPTRPAPPGEGAVLLFSVRGILRNEFVGVGLVATGKLPDGRQDSKSYIVTLPRSKATGISDTLDSKALRLVVEQPPLNTMRWSQADGRASASAVVPFTFSPATAHSPDGTRLAFLSVEPSATGGTYTLKMMRSTGEPLFSRSYPFAGLAIPGSVRDSVMEHFGTQPDGRQMFSPAAMAVFRGEMKNRFPKFYSPVSRVYLGMDNATWIQMRRPDPKSPATLVLIDDRGNPVASVDLPPRHSVYAASRDHIWAVVTDDDDLPSVVRYRIR